MRKTNQSGFNGDESTMCNINQSGFDLTMNESLNVLAEDIGINPNHTLHETSHNISRCHDFDPVATKVMVDAIRQKKIRETGGLYCLVSHRAEKLIDVRFSNYEWQKAKEHVIYPGPGAPFSKNEWINVNFLQTRNDDDEDLLSSSMECCAICLDSILIRKEEREMMTFLSCNHVFCTKCQGAGEI